MNSIKTLYKLMEVSSRDLEIPDEMCIRDRSWAVCVTNRWWSTSRRKWGWDRTVAQDEKSKRSP